MRKRWKFLIVPAFLVAAAGLLLFSHQRREPAYQGRSLTQWIQSYREADATSGTTAQHQEAEEALCHIGTNAIPFLLAWFAADALAERFGHLLERAPLPHRIKILLYHATGEGKREYRYKQAATAFQILAEQAAPAVPGLTKLLNQTNTFRPRLEAACALASIGKEGLPPLLHALADTNYPHRQVILTAMMGMNHLGTNANLAAPVLIGLMQPPTSGLEPLALEAMKDLKIDQETIFPALTNALRSPDKGVRCLTARYFEIRFQELGQRAVPILQTMLNDPDATVRYTVTNTLRTIAPEVLTNAPLQ